jgi:hypothetical protein
MKVDRDSTERKQGIQVLMDGQPVRLPSRVLKSLAAVRAQLELIALRQERVLAALEVDVEAVNLPAAASWTKDFRCVAAQTMSFLDLGRHMAATALKQVQSLQVRSEAASALVLINEWPAIGQLIQGLEADLNAVLVVVSFLHELCGPCLADATMDGASMLDHLERLNVIRNRLAMVVQKQRADALSDVLNQRVAPWLERLAEYLSMLNEV